MIGKLEPAELRTLWKNEALDFTSWLAENLEVLKEQLGLELSIVEQEKSVGPFSVDLLAKDAAGRSVIIENQLERTDHDHLGKVLTYLANLDAKVAIWISSDPRPEHVTAIDYLNENVPSDTEFYLVKLQAFRIGGSAPAPLFTIEAGPSPERTAAGETKKDLADKDTKRYEFFRQLLDCCGKKTGLFDNVSPVGYQGFENATAGKGVLWGLVVAEKTSRVELCFYGSTNEVNQNRFESLAGHKQEIEKAFGEPLSWDFKEGRKQQYIRSVSSIGGLENEDRWKDVQNDLVDRLVRMETAVKPWLKQIS